MCRPARKEATTVLKILMVPSWYITEDKPMNGIFFREQAKALISAGHDVRVVYPDVRFKLGKLPRGLISGGDDPKTYIMRRRTFTPFSERGRRPLRSRMLEALYGEATADWGAPDIVQLESCRIGPETLGLCARHDLPVVYTEHYSGLLRGADAVLGGAFRRTLDGCCAAVAVSSCLRDKMEPIRPDTVVVPNPVDTVKFCMTRPPQQIEHFTFAAMGALTSVKRYDLLIRAFALAHSGLEGAKLVIAGDGPLREPLAALAKKLGVAGSVTFMGSVERERAPEFYNSVSCVVCSSDFETFGITLIEALACGRPLISTSCGGPRDIVTPRNGVLVSPDDVGALASAMRGIYGAFGRYDSDAIAADCALRFGTVTFAKRMTEIYVETIKERNASRKI